LGGVDLPNKIAKILVINFGDKLFMSKIAMEDVPFYQNPTFWLLDAKFHLQLSSF
jgi:hypothetical protein